MLYIGKYDAYGKCFGRLENSQAQYKFTGQEYEPESGLYNFRARMYFDEEVLFGQTDPANQTFAPYSYCLGNPIMFVDPTGRSHTYFRTPDQDADENEEYLDENYAQRVADIESKRRFDAMPKTAKDAAKKGKMKLKGGRIEKKENDMMVLIGWDLANVNEANSYMPILFFTTRIDWLWVPDGSGFNMPGGIDYDKLIPKIKFGKVEQLTSYPHSLGRFELKYGFNLQFGQVNIDLERKVDVSSEIIPGSGIEFHFLSGFTKEDDKFFIGEALSYKSSENGTYSAMGFNWVFDEKVAIKTAAAVILIYTGQYIPAIGKILQAAPALK